MSLAQEVYLLETGRIRDKGTPDELRNADNPQVRDFLEGNAPVDEDTETLLKSAG